MPVDVIDPTQLPPDWEPRDKDVKKYIHFDRHLPLSKLKSIANDPERVARHPFFPLLLFKEDWVKFRKSKERVKKIRPLRFSARIDAAIFARYRALLSSKYEAELALRGLMEVPVAYRRLRKEPDGYKCNIDIAKDVFSFIRDNCDCFVTVVDIKSYFESLDHSKIREKWEILIGAPLPPDHEAVFNAVTKYTVVDLKRLFSRLKLEQPAGSSTRRERRTRKIDELRELRHKQICSPAEFREIVAKTTPNNPSLLQKNGFDFGIPQGTPISDIIANFYLLDFDETINEWVKSKNGLYQRYSDDIIIVVPTNGTQSTDEAKSFLQSEIKKHGSKLKIQDKKVSISHFRYENEKIHYRHIFGKASRNGLEYLGFEYNGSVVKIKNSTLSNAWRKINRRAHGHASRYVKRFRDKGAVWLVNNYPFDRLEKEMLRDVTYKQDTGVETWTFIRYTRRASKTFIGFNPIFSRQTRRYRRYTKKIIAEAFDTALRNHI